MPESSWRLQAICSDSPYKDMAFGDDLDEDEPHSTADAEEFVRTHCNNCPVKLPCKLYGKRNSFEFGVFGGMLPSERNVFDSETADHSGTN